MSNTNTISQYQTARQMLVERVIHPRSIYKRESVTLTDLDIYALNRMQEALWSIRNLSRKELTPEGKQYIDDLANHAINLPDHLGNWHSQRSWPNITDVDVDQKTYENELMRLDDMVLAHTDGEAFKRLVVTDRAPQMALRLAVKWTISGLLGGLLGGFFIGQFFV